MKNYFMLVVIAIRPHSSVNINPEAKLCNLLKTQ